eukprot:TRINITY_DN29904_c0_g1_i1.p1 TRINITY_DN29904_c0_g1~~TRINITY_DN29904_c0_g1_i1.p1  ORF type:complete len:192 (-),score=30.36 TRINITY_DN29904_c0_g1_i1:23-598(-)
MATSDASSASDLESPGNAWEQRRLRRRRYVGVALLCAGLLLVLAGYFGLTTDSREEIQPEPADVLQARPGSQGAAVARDFFGGGDSCHRILDTTCYFSGCPESLGPTRCHPILRRCECQDTATGEYCEVDGKCMPSFLKKFNCERYSGGTCFVGQCSGNNEFCEQPGWCKCQEAHCYKNGECKFTFLGGLR